MNLYLPKRRKREKLGVRESTVYRSDSYLQHVRGFCCAIMGKPGHECSGRMHAHHCREGSDGGTGMKPSDSTAVPLCDLAHTEIHNSGWKTFETKYQIDLSALAARIWRASKHRVEWERRL